MLPYPVKASLENGDVLAWRVLLKRDERQHKPYVQHLYPPRREWNYPAAKRKSDGTAARSGGEEVNAVKQYLKKWISDLVADFGWNYKTIYKVALIGAVFLYVVLFLLDWKETGKPNLPELRSFLVILGGWAF